MALGSTKAKNISLDACYGSNKSASWVGTVYCHLYVGDPTGAGTELTTAGSYAPVAITNNSTNFPNASAGQKSNGTAITFTTSTAAWSGSPTYFALTDASAALAAPAAPSVANVGTAGTTTYQYQITTLNANGETTASATGQTTTGNATLNGTNYNTVSWSAVSGATGYNVYKWNGSVWALLAANNATTSYNDQGGALTPATNPPSSNTTMNLLDYGALSAAASVPASGYTASFAIGALVITAA